MIRIAVSGHRNLSPEITTLIDDAIRSLLTEYTPPLTGLSCLADGADQIFARAVIDLGGTLEVVTPARRYREGLPAEAHQEYDALLARAEQDHTMDFIESTAESHMAASRFMLDHADELLAVWDGKPARGYGGTADVVAEARERGLRIHVIWPKGAQR
ncbi:hypothetical protein ABT352_00230 [Streptosporangium sp. NPDC000563]|uniref:hypothetical protein n=1 Tax=unclassified Streptosporangium TaxID=2632669 RepID=UPI00332FA5CF